MSLLPLCFTYFKTFPLHLAGDLLRLRPQHKSKGMIYYYYYYLVNEKIGKECTLAIWTLTLLGINAGNVQVVGYYDNDIVVFVVVYLLYVFTSSNWWLTHEIRWQEVSSILQNFLLLLLLLLREYIVNKVTLDTNIRSPIYSSRYSVW